MHVTFLMNYLHQRLCRTGHEEDESNFVIFENLGKKTSHNLQALSTCSARKKIDDTKLKTNDVRTDEKRDRVKIPLNPNCY